MSVQSDSIVGLFSKLCDLHLGEKKRCHLTQPKVQRDVHFQHLRRKAFDALFSFLKSPESKENGVGTGIIRAEVDQVLQAVYHLRLQRRFEDADRLELLLEQLLSNSTAESQRIMRFLVRLAGNGGKSFLPPLGHDIYNTPVATEETAKQKTLPAGPLVYGDLKQVTLSTASSTTIAQYMQFPSQLFEAYTPAICHRLPPQARPLSIFALPPGRGIGGSVLFSVEREYRDQHEYETRLSLFGGLVHARDTSLAVRLDLPDLPDDPQSSPPEIMIPKAISMSELSEDEGFITTEASSTVTTPAESFVEEDIWELALTTTPSQHYVWERIGCEPMVTERSYLTEMGPQAVDELYHLRRHNEHLLDPGTWQPPVRQVSSAQLVKDIIYLLIGFPSCTFPFSLAEDSFTINPTVSTSGLSPESLHSFLVDFTECGTLYHRLALFSAPRELDSLFTGGLVIQAFTGAIRSVLQSYRAVVLSLPRDLTLLGMKMHCHDALRQIRFLAELCHCDEKYPTAGPDASFLTGVPLISYLYQETLASVNTDNYLLMLFLLRTTCQPFVMFVQDWVFHGTFRDVYGEFMIQVNHQFLEARDEQYWEKGYTLTTEDETATMPTFLVDLAPAIFRCGKALNLLKMCNPQHFLCCTSDSEIPRIFISYARSDLRDIGVQCQMYVSRMQQIARQLTMSRADKLRRAADAQHELLETARRMAAMEIARLQGILDGRKQKADAKKRKEFKRLKDQMTTDLQRRAGEVVEAKEEDRQHMARLTRQEDALTEQEIELEKEARDELIAYYTELGEEAAKREQRALWRIRRARLETTRMQFLEEDERKWKAEIEEQKQAQDLLHKTEDSDSLPDWAQRQDGSTEPLHVSGTGHWQKETDTQVKERDVSLPKWVERKENDQDSDSLTVQDEESTPSVDEQDVDGEDGDSKPTTTVSESVELTTSVSQGLESPKLVSQSEEPTRSDSQTVEPTRSDSQTVEPTRSDSQTVEPTTTVSPRVDSVSSVAASQPEPEAKEKVKLKPSGEDHMPSWAQKMLNQSCGSNIETVIVDEDDDADGPSLPPQSSGSGETVIAQDGIDSESEPQASSASQDGDQTGQVAVSGRTSRMKKTIRMVDGVSTDQETEEGQSRPHIQISQTQNATTESSAVEQRPHVKQVAGMSATTETQAEESQKSHIKMSGAMQATKETEEEVQRPHLKVVAGSNANLESQEEIQSIPKMAGSSQYNITTETTSSLWKIKTQSLFGHVSQLSREDYTFQAPKLKRHHSQYANLESDFREFAIKPRIHMHKTRSAVAESAEQVDRPLIRSYAGRHATRESEFVDIDKIHRKRFMEQNMFGHASDSTVQRLLYGEDFGSRTKQGTEEILEALQLVPRFEVDALDLMPDLEKYEENFNHLNGQPVMDLMASMPGVVQGGLGGVGGELELSEEEADAIAFTPLAKLLQQALTAPLSAQISLVNETVVNYFLVELKIDTHFEALHRYLFMADGDFAQNLTDILLDKFSSCQMPYEMLTPVFLNSGLNRALQLSAAGKTQHGDNLSFSLRYMPDFFMHNAHDTLDCLELRYKVEWPINVVLTEASQACYGQVFSFMLQLKRVVWTLTDCWYKLKRDAIVKKAKDSSQFRQLQLHRHEMQHFVRVMQGYMANQIIQVTWKELQESLDHDVHSLDDLKRVHADYLHKALFRCLLNKKAAPIMKIIRDIFCLILKFCSQLSGATWGENPDTREVTHPNFSAMVASYKAFKEYFVFLFKVVNKLAVRGYQPHLHELLLRLNFNNYYTSK
ncbi:gamma-tubulin complex component 6-like [Littorina saxatilis]|uniref:gamma-tubulin complex component 6-like n=1 Tax=Littorina saxatilis TaxID=31220 RepID=UPI0038B5A77B